MSERTASPPSRLSPVHSEKQDVEYVGTGGQTAAKVSRFTTGPATQSDDKRTKKILRKLDLRLMPICALLYLISFLDRSAIGNARVAGLQVDLGMTDTLYALAVALFFPLYGLLEVPSNLVMKRVGAKIWLPTITMAWGIVMTLSGVAQTGAGLIVARIFLGATEAGLFPGISALLSFLYPRAQIQFRLGIFFSAATAAGAFGGLLAYGVTGIRAGNLAGWRWLFVIEGLITVVAAVVAYFLLVSSYDNAKFLSTEEKEYMQDRLHYDGTEVPMDNSFQWTYVRQGLIDWKLWISVVTYILVVGPLYSIALALPSILRAFNYNAVDAQLFTVPVYCVAAVTTIAFAYLSDRFRCRTFFCVLGVSISLIGWIISYVSFNNRARYGGMFLAASGTYAAFPSVVALLSQNIAGRTKRATSLGVQIGAGGLIGMLPGFIFPASDPRYNLGHRVNIAFNSCAIATSLINFGLLYLANKRKQRILDSGEADKIAEEDLPKMLDNSPYFKYLY